MACALFAHIPVHLVATGARGDVIRCLVACGASGQAVFISSPESDLTATLLGKGDAENDPEIKHLPFWRGWCPKTCSVFWEMWRRQGEIALAQAQTFVNEKPDCRVVVKTKSPVVMEFTQDASQAAHRVFCVHSPNDLVENDGCAQLTKFAQATTKQDRPFLVVLLVDCEDVSFESLAAFCRRAGVDVRKVMFPQVVRARAFSLSTLTNT
jgi:hypothetical protein